MNLSRFNRTYMLTVQTSDDRAIVVQPPFRVAFSVDKSIDTTLNKMVIKVYNLKDEHRTALVKDDNDDKKIGVDLAVGYGETVDRIFKGTVHAGTVAREGVDMVLTLECQDGGYDFRYGYTSQCTTGDPIDTLLKDMPNTAKGKITATRPKSTRPTVLVGNSYKLLGKVLSGQKWFIDDEALNVINKNEVLSDVIPVVESATGLLNTPTREEKKVTIVTILNPSLRVGNLYELRSSTARHLNGIYKIETIGYDGDIDGSNWQQTVVGTLTKDYVVLQ